MKRDKVEFWAVFCNGKFWCIGFDENQAKEIALKMSDYRWTEQTKDKDWEYLVKDGCELIKTELVPVEDL